MSKGDQPAFPGLQTFEKFNDERGSYEEYTLPAGGLTVRQYFAAMAMQGLLTADNFTFNEYAAGRNYLDIVQQAVMSADALIAELEKMKD